MYPGGLLNEPYPYDDRSRSSLTHRQPSDTVIICALTSDEGEEKIKKSLWRSPSVFGRMTSLVTRCSHRWRVQALAMAILIVGLYMLLFGAHKPIKANLNELDDLDVSVIEQELENSKKVEIVTYEPPRNDAYAWAKVPRRYGGNPITDLDRTMKYHRVWSWANKVTNSHELFPDTSDVEEVLVSLATAKIVFVDVLDLTESYESGTSEKWLIVLEGGQKAMMKLVWESRGGMKQHALCNLGYEMPAGEIAGFHLHRVMGFRNTPYATGRRVNLRTEIIPVASPAVAKQITLRSNSGNTTCVTGKCFYCKESTTMCPSDGVVEASIVYWVPRNLKLYTYPPKYMPFSTPNMEEWGDIPLNNKTYCTKVRSTHPYDVDRYYHDLSDFSIIDTLMYHFDSKHYIIHDDGVAHGLTVRLDHGRAFCAYDRDNDKVFLAPLRQCCVLRRATLWKMKSLSGGQLSARLRSALSNDPLAPLLIDQWYTALDRRLELVMITAEACAKANGGWDNILVG